MDDRWHGWSPTYFSGRRFPATWAGGPDDWQVTERTARTRHAEGKGVVTGWAGPDGALTLLRFPIEAPTAYDAVVEHVPSGTPGRAYRAALMGPDLVELSVSVPRGTPFGGRRTLARYSPVERDAAHGIRTQRHVTPRDPVHLTRTALPRPPQAEALRAWQPVDALVDVCDRLPAMVADLEAGEWLERHSDARERADAAVASVRADERLREMLAARRKPRSGLFRRRHDDDLDWAVGAERLAEVLAEACPGRRVSRHRDDQSRIVAVPVADGEATMAVTVERPANLPLRVSGLVVYVEGHATTWSARQDDWQGDPASEDELRTLLGVGLDVLDAYAAALATPVRTTFTPVTLARLE